MRIALDPYMHRHLALEALPGLAARLGYEWIDLSPRGDLFAWFKAPRVFPDRIKSFNKALSDSGVASLLPMYRWASNDETERRAAVRHWKRAFEIAVEMGVDTMNSEFGRGPNPDKGTCYCCHGGSMIEASEDAWWRSMHELVPILEKEGINLHIEPHPEDWVEMLQPSVDLIRTVDIPRVKFLYCSPHTFYFGDDIPAKSARAPAPRHQGEVPWDDFFGTLAEVGFDGIITACVFAWGSAPRTRGASCARRCNATSTSTGRSDAPRATGEDRHDTQHWRRWYRHDRARPHPPRHRRAGRRQGRRRHRS